MSDTMKAVDIKGGKGPSSALFINTSTPKPTPKAGEVLVRIKAFGLNRMDLLQREGQYPLPPQAPSTLGVEFSGVIESFGPSSFSHPSSSSSFQKGDAVFGLAYGGAYAEYIAVDARMLLHKPSSMSWETAAGIPETFITATQALHLVGDFAPGKTVLWHAGASGVSIAGIQLSRDAGAEAVFATAGTDDKCRFVERELGATKAFNYKKSGDHDWAQGVLDATGGKGVDLIVDFVGASYFEKNLKVAARDARWVMLGLMGGSKLEGVDIGQILFKRLRIEGSTLRSRDVEYQGKLRDRLAEYIPHFESGKLKVKIDSVFPMDDIVKAHDLLEKNVTTGKIICTVP
ncbi:zinc-binding alcohol dehydrogenase domain-containing protein 2 [Xylariaceae sp. FL0594]|nr:zinc-binding alcohol dehydrogenase domain-containing protein 2 [Xylariaceae sp. FL0594]